MAILGVEKVAVLVKVLFQEKRGIRKMQPRFTDEDEGWIFILYNLEQIEYITGKTLNVPCQILYVQTNTSIRVF